MTKAQATFIINGVQWQEKQLDRLEYERNLHILHSMKQHGIDIKDGNKSLSDDDIDYLTEQQAWDVSINNRLQYKDQAIIDIYQDSLKKSDAFWKKMAFSQDKPMKVSHTQMTITGVTLDKYMQVMHAMQEDDRVGLAAHPEHFACSFNWDNGKLVGIEPFGMYGTPTLVQVNVLPSDDALSDQILADKDPSYPVTMAGEAFLTDEKTAVNVPYHQYKPTDNGFEAKLAVYWPEHVPDEIVEGHSFHLAMEFYGGLRYIEQLPD